MTERQGKVCEQGCGADPRALWLLGFANGWAKTDAQREALLLLIAGKRQIDVAKALGLSKPRTSKMWKRFKSAVKKNQQKNPSFSSACGSGGEFQEGQDDGEQNEGGEGEEGSAVEGSEEDGETEHEDEEERVDQDARW